MYEFLRNKILSYQTPPPEDGWEALREQLDDENFMSSFSSRLADYEAAPPDGSWESIRSVLDENNPTKAPASGQNIRGIESYQTESDKTVSERKIRPLRWLAAAALLGLLVTGSYYFINSINQQEIRIASDPRQIGNPDSERRPLSEQQPATASSTYSPATTDQHPAKSAGNSYYSRSYQNIYYGRKNSDHKKLLASVAERPLYSSPVQESTTVDMPPVLISPGKIYGKNGELIQDLSIVNPQNSQYVKITAPNGQQTRISAKLAVAMPYMGAVTSGSGASGNYYWKQLIQKWQDKIMQSDFVPSSANFLDILEFSDLILE